MSSVLTAAAPALQSAVLQRANSQRETHPGCSRAAPHCSSPGSATALQRAAPGEGHCFHLFEQLEKTE